MVKTKLSFSYALPQRLAELIAWALKESPCKRPTALQLRDMLEQFVDDARRGLCGDDIDVTLEHATPLSCSATTPPAGAGHGLALTVDESMMSGAETLSMQRCDAQVPPLVALWGFSDEEAQQLRAALKSHGLQGFGWRRTEKPPTQLCGFPVQVILMPADQPAIERLKSLRADPKRRTTPAIAAGVVRADHILPLLRAGANDISLAKASAEQTCQLVSRLIGRA